jgi:hypothetical protein
MICWSLREFIDAELSRSAQRRKVPLIRELRAQRQAQAAPAPKGCKPLRARLLHVELQYLTVMPDVTRRRSWPLIARPAGWIWESSGASL